MLLSPRIVFVIDRYQNIEDDLRKVISNINLSCLRILSYYAHTYCTDGMKLSLLWGYKFFNSSKYEGAYHYKQCQFLEYTTNNFEEFENKLHDGVWCCNQGEKGEKMKRGELLKVALTEIITDFQWDRPQLLSPGKIWKKREDENEGESKNLVFLFTSSPTDPSSYFDKSYVDSTSFLESLFPTVLFKRFVHHLKISLCWLNTGDEVTSKQGNDSCHILRDGLANIGGTYIGMNYLSSWWIHNAANKSHIYSDLISVSSLVGALLEKSPLCDEKLQISKYQLSYEDEITGAYHACISICSVTNGFAESPNGEGDKYITVKEVVNLKDLSLASISNSGAFFYALHPGDAGDAKFIILLKEKLVAKEALKVEFCSPHGDMVCDAVMIPFTSHSGTIVLLDSCGLYNRDVKRRMMRCEKEEDKTVNDKEVALQRALDKMMERQDFGSSLVNAVDDWFLYNPKLGFPLGTKTLLSSLCNNRIAMRKKREEKSKVVLEYMKGIYAKENAKLDHQQSRSKHKKSNRPKGSTFSRLKEHLKKVKEEAQSRSNLNSGENVKEAEDISKCEKVEFQGFRSEEDLKRFVQLEYNIMTQDSVCPNQVENLLGTAMQYFSSCNSDSYQESTLNFLDSFILHTVIDIRDSNTYNSKEELVKEYLLQVQLHLECISQFHLLSDTQSLLNKVVSFLRAVSFEKDTEFVLDHLKSAILPRFLHKLAMPLREIYENLMLDIPKSLLLSEDICDDSSPAKSVDIPSIASYCSSDNSPHLSLKAEKRTLRRIPSAVGDNMNKKVIAVQVKKTKKENVKINSNSNVADKAVKRSLFTRHESQQNLLSTPKLRRRNSESVLKRVPDTPETRQLNDMIWKKQDKKRRSSNVDKTLISIEESPLKQIVSMKGRSSFVHSSSFNCHTSPRRFYKIQRHPSCHFTSSPNKQSGRCEFSFTGINEMSKEFSDNAPLEVKLRRKSSLFSNFDDNENADSDENDMEVSIANFHTNHRIKPVGDFIQASPSPRKICHSKNNRGERVRFALTNHDSFKPSIQSDRLFEQSPKRIKISDNNGNFDPFEEYDTFTTVDSDMNNERINCDIEQSVMTETTVDWVNEIEKDQAATGVKKSFRDAFDNLSKLPDNLILKSPSIVKAGNDSIKVSPNLSASSLEILENAPILSPVVTKRKLGRRRLLKAEYK